MSYVLTAAQPTADAPLTLPAPPAPEPAPVIRTTQRIAYTPFRVSAPPPARAPPRPPSTAPPHA